MKNVLIDASVPGALRSVISRSCVSVNISDVLYCQREEGGREGGGEMLFLLMLIMLH